MEMEEIGELRERIRFLEEENARLRSCSDKHDNIIPCENSCHKNEDVEAVGLEVTIDPSAVKGYRGDLKPTEIERYSRQLLLKGGFGVEGQLKLLKSSILIVGAGGIGSTGKESEFMQWELTVLYLGRDTLRTFTFPFPCWLLSLLLD
mmetsp:Transcript_3484/g.7515  ORF Transcript_3484/g.7515 Transcript_3484/m.7515 type:complete len:148 (-) Transcript_3484:2186-2629(-)